jgi:hypothetical protein
VRTYHSHPYTSAKWSAGSRSADVVSGIWLAWAAMAARLASSTARTSTAASTATDGTPMWDRTRPRSPARIASSTRWVSTKCRYSRSMVAS